MPQPLGEERVCTYCRPDAHAGRPSGGCRAGSARSFASTVESDGGVRGGAEAAPNGGLVVLWTPALFLQRGQRFSRVYRPVPSVTGSPGLRPHARSSRSTALLLTYRVPSGAPLAEAAARGFGRVRTGPSDASGLSLELSEAPGDLPLGSNALRRRRLGRQ